MASEPRPIESGAVEDIDFGRDPAQRTMPEDVPLVPERPGLQADSEYDAYARHPAAEDYTTRRTRTRALLVGFLAVLALVGVVWFAYQWGLETGYRVEVPTIQATQEPLKSKPDNPGGLVVPNQDKLVLNRASDGEPEPKVERLLSAPESPQPVPQAEPPPEAAAPVPAAPREPVETQASKPPAPPEPLNAAETESGGAAMGIAGSELVAKSREREAAPAPKVTRETRPEPAPQVAQAPAAVTPPAAPSPEPVSRIVAAEPAASGSLQSPATGGGGGGGAKVMGTQVAAITKGDFVIQLAAVGSGEAAQKEWQRLQRSFPDLLGDMSLSVQEVTVKGKLYHRVQTGPFPSRATAQDMCAQIKLGKQACIVQRR